MILEFQTQRQVLHEWCWAAVASSISLKYDPNSPWQQNVLAANLLNNVCKNVNPDNASTAPDICHQGYSLIQAMQVCTGNYAWDVQRYLTLDEVYHQINNGWPICCQIHWDNPPQEHYIIIYGYDGNSIAIGDPEAGVCSSDYSDLINSYRSGQWVRTYGTQSSNSW